MSFSIHAFTSSVANVYKDAVIQGATPEQNKLLHEMASHVLRALDETNAIHNRITACFLANRAEGALQLSLKRVRKDAAIWGDLDVLGSALRAAESFACERNAELHGGYATV